MTVLCLALALGPDRIVDWLRDEWTGREDRDEPVGWIEEA
jgi:hypothetical protein